MLHDLSGKSVLIVDDEQALRALLKIEFEDYFSDVSVAESGQHAIELLKEKKFDIVFTDMKMPNGDGLWLASKIQEELHQTPQIYMCSGYNDNTSERMKELDIIKVFPKPFDFVVMISEIIKNI